MGDKQVTQIRTAKALHQHRETKAAKQPLPTRVPVHPLLQLQRQVGNQAVTRLIQAKLTIGEPGDKYEQEADRVASLVVSQINAPTPQQSSQGQTVQREEMPQEDEIQTKPEISSIQRQEMPEDEKLQTKPEISSIQRQEMPEDEKLQTKPMVQRQPGGDGMAATPQLEASIQQARGGGQPLSESLRKPMEQAFGADFSGVRVHTDATSDQLNQSIQAKAFTTGQDIFFRQGEYDPENRKELLAHELTHVVQQSGGAVQRMQLSEKEQVLQSAISLKRDRSIKGESEAPSEGMGTPEEKVGLNFLSTTVGNPSVQRLIGKNSPLSTESFSTVHQHTIPNVRVSLIHENSSSATQQSNASTTIQCLAVMVSFNPAPPMGGNRTVHIELIDRGTDTGGGAHTTGFDVFVKQLEAAVEGKTYANAMLNVRRLVSAITQMPGYQQSGHMFQQMYNAAAQQILDLIPNSAVALDAHPDLDKTSNLQNVMRSYLYLRNSLMFTINPNRAGNLPSSGNVATGITDMRAAYASAAPGRTQNFGKGMVEAFDYNALDPKQQTENNQNYASRIAAPLAQHVLSCMQMFPGILPVDQQAFQQNFLVRTKNQLNLNPDQNTKTVAAVKALTGIA